MTWEKNMSRYDKDKDYYDEGRRDAKYGDKPDLPNGGPNPFSEGTFSDYDKARDDYGGGRRWWRQEVDVSHARTVSTIVEDRYDDKHRKR